MPFRVKLPPIVVFPLNKTLKASLLLEASTPLPITKAGANVLKDVALVAVDPDELC